MRRSVGAALLVVGVLALASACGITEEGGLQVTDDAGVDGSAGSGGNVNNGSCFPGSKVCPDSQGQLRCVEANTAATGCSDSTGCSPCSLPNASAMCAVTGECVIDQCNPGWQDCNLDPIDGCETNVDGDPSHCGTCAIDCKVTKGQNWICEAGGCIVNYCEPDSLLDCDKDKSNGCEVDGNTDVANCKFCGNACSLAHATNECSGQVCKIKACDAGWANCDGNETNGCETNTASDPGNCGACGTQCNSTNGVPGCNAGKCAIVCSAPYGNCDNNLTNGCETNTSSSPGHCGGCGKGCALTQANQACSNGACTIASCKAGFGNCDGNVGNGCETNLNSDPKHCGACPTACSAPANAAATCGTAKCGFTCNQGFSTCGSGTTCFDTQKDANHCGACKVCPGPASGAGTPACSAGNCTVACKAGFSQCGNDCFDLKVDQKHCGSCTKACVAPTGGTTSCVASVCQSACPSSATLCGTACVDTQTSNANCGGCGKSCTGGMACSGGNCSCPSGKMNCGNGVCVACCGNGDCSGSDKCCSGVCKGSC